MQAKAARHSAKRDGGPASFRNELRLASQAPPSQKLTLSSHDTWQSLQYQFEALHQHFERSQVSQPANAVQSAA
jgi:hypothetical protein